MGLRLFLGWSQVGLISKCVTTGTTLAPRSRNMPAPNAGRPCWGLAAGCKPSSSQPGSSEDRALKG